MPPPPLSQVKVEKKYKKFEFLADFGMQPIKILLQHYHIFPVI